MAARGERIPVVAHRGYARTCPENTLPALQAAIDAGARYVEFDVQLSADGVPFLFHDADLARTTGVPGDPTASGWSALRALEANETGRLGERFAGVRIPSLDDAVELLAKYPAVTAFVEIKRHSLRRFGHAAMLSAIMRALQPVLAQAVVISFDAAAIASARTRGAPSIGWVLSDWSNGALEEARRLQPDYLFCNHQRLPPAPQRLWPGAWAWVIYEVTDGEHARSLATQGADMIETMAVGEMLSVLGGDTSV